MRKLIRHTFLCSITLWLCGLNNCSADVSLPSNVDPGAINNELRLQSEIRLLPSKQEDIDTSKIIIQDEVTVCKGQKFKLNRVTYKGNTIFKAEILAKISEKLVGQQVSFADLNEVTNAITNLYKKEGYLTSRAIIPPQEITNGNVVIQIVEGTVGSIKIEGGRWVKADYVMNSFLKSNSIEEDKIFNIRALSRSMEELNTPKYLKGQVMLEKGKKTGETDIVLDLKDRFPLSFGIGWDNTGRELVGIQRAGLFTSLENVTGIGDRLWVNNTLSTGTYGLDAGYSIPLDEKGTKLVFGYSMSNTNLGGEYSAYNVKGKSNNFSTSIVRSLLKGKDYEVNSRIAFDMMNAKTTMLGSQTLNDYSLRVLRAGISANKTDSDGRWIGDAVVSAGLPCLGGTQTDNYGEPNANFVKLNTYLTRVQKLPKDCLGIIRLNTQFSSSSLFPAEQMQLGGAYTVRGYNEGAMLGDAGYVLSFEARSPIPFLPQMIEPYYWPGKSIKIPIKDSVKFAVFYDQGLTHLVQQSTPATSQNFFNSVGAGLRISLGHHTTANIDLGIPIGPSKYDGQSPVRLHFSISTDVL